MSGRSGPLNFDEIEDLPCRLCEVHNHLESIVSLTKIKKLHVVHTVCMLKLRISFLTSEEEKSKEAKE